MQTYEIPRDRWPVDVMAFGETHRRWLASVEVLDDEMGAQPEVRDLPLEGISVEPPDKGALVSIFMVRSPDDHLTHQIQNPTHIRIEQSEDDREAAMQIEAADGTSTIVRLVPPRER